MDIRDKWIRADATLDYDKNCDYPVIIENTGNLTIDFYKYANSFYESAECIMLYLIEESGKDGNIRELDLWYFAVMFLYRHSFELIIKAAIFKENVSNESRKSILKNLKHDLKKGWDKLIEIYGLNDDINNNMKWMGEYLDNISRVDSKADMFRYPFDSNYDLFFSQATFIDLDATYDNMARAYDVLDNLYKHGNISDAEYNVHQPRLIIEGGVWERQSYVGYKSSQYSYYPLFFSYLETAGYLHRKIIGCNKEEYFIPMCCMYRNAVELGMKRIIVGDCLYDNVGKKKIIKDKELKSIKKKKHSIYGLWHTAYDEIISVSIIQDNSADVQQANKYIEMIHDLDVKSYKFRYPCDENLKTCYAKKKYFDVENLAGIYEELCSFLNACICA